jgi:asparagine synthase (glutamine-hydrolysing)
MGFSVPLAAWLRGPLKDRVRSALQGERMRDCGYFNPATISRLIDEHNSGMRDHATALWMLLMFEAFLRVNEGALVGAAALH